MELNRIGGDHQQMLQVHRQ